MRINSALVPSYNHYHAISGRGFADIHAFRSAGAVRGKGWFGNLVSKATPFLKTATGVAKNAIVAGAKAAGNAALQAGAAHLASGGSLQGALMAGAQGGQAAGLSAVQRSVMGGGYSSRKRPRRPRI